MNKVDDLRKVIKILMLSLLGVTAFIFVLFIIHAIDVRNYNSQWRVITAESTSTQVMVDVHPRGGVTDSWVKVETGLGTDLNAKIYEMVISNNAQTTLEDWYLRINVNDNCYLNNGWCGTFEIHQFDEAGNELTQTVDLRNFKHEDLKVRYHQADQDLLIPLTYGDYLIYHPDTSEGSGEVPIKGTTEFAGTCACGIIMYSKTGEINFNNYELSYRLHKSVWDGTKGSLFVGAFVFMAISFLILGTVFFVSIRFEEKLVNRDKTLEDMFKLCCNVADSRDYHSKEHSKRVAEYSQMIAEKMGMDGSDCDLVYHAALLHDIGNVFVSEQILRKSGKLTREEFSEVKNHVIRGVELLRGLDYLPMAAEAVLFHHERFDGTGYPHGKKEDEIPLIARIVAVAEAYDAMNNDRPYRSKLTHDQIREEFINNRGSQFDPAIVTAFLDIMGERNL